MNTHEILEDAAQRPAQSAAAVIKDLTPDVANKMPGDSRNSITWLLWHSGREIDVQLAALTGETQEWESGDWAAKLGIDRPSSELGFGDSADGVRATTTENVAGLGEYLQVCTDRLVAYIRTLDDDALSEIVDENYDPPVKRGARIVSIIDDAVAHVGQAAYARGLVEDWSIGH